MKSKVTFLLVILSFQLGAQITGLSNLSYQFQLTEVWNNHVNGILTVSNPNAQVYMLAENYPPVANVVRVWAGTVLDNIDDLQWNLSFTDITDISIHCDLSIHNPTNLLWQRDYIYHPLFDIQVDDNIGSFMYMEYPDVFSLEPGETVVHSIGNYYDSAIPPLVAYPEGTHTVRTIAHFNPGAYVGNEFHFTVLPSSAEDNCATLAKCNIIPNPFIGNATITIHEDKYSTGTITIYNLKGQRVNTLPNIPLLAGENSYQWQAVDCFGKKLSSGIYFVKLTSNGHSSILRAVVMK